MGTGRSITGIFTGAEKHKKIKLRSASKNVQTQHFMDEGKGLTALTELHTVVVDVCGEKQEAWQG